VVGKTILMKEGRGGWKDYPYEGGTGWLEK